MDPAIPAIKITHDTDPISIRRPERKQDAIDPIGLMGVGAQEAIGMPMGTLPK